FFFSSRRRHTRWPRDWSSDVCSSDLIAGGRPVTQAPIAVTDRAVYQVLEAADGQDLYVTVPDKPGLFRVPISGGSLVPVPVPVEIGRASCRERVESVGVGGVLNKTIR